MKHTFQYYLVHILHIFYSIVKLNILNIYFCFILSFIHSLLAVTYFEPLTITNCDIYRLYNLFSLNNNIVKQ